jgi:hypothetical protein
LFADGLVDAVDTDGSGAVAVAEQPVGSECHE